jgi:tripartite-type tricarboxylate transporter receptor subunit TctC
MGVISTANPREFQFDVVKMERLPMSLAFIGLRSALAILCCASQFLAFVAPAQAQTYPARPINLVVAVQAGTAGDLVGRVLAESVGNKLGQRIVVENVVGAGGAIGAQRVARANPDGYTLGLFNNGVHAILPNMGTPLGFDPWTDLAPVTLLVETASVLIASPNLKANSLRELIAMAKAAPDKLNYASVAFGSPQHLAMEELKSQAGIEMMHVPYRGGAQATLAIAQSEVDVFWINVSVALPFIQSGKVRPLAVGSRERVSVLPDVPTVREQGLPDYEYTGLYTLFAPARTPDAVMATLSKAFAEGLADPKVVAILKQQGFTPHPSTAAEVTEMLRQENSRLAPIMKRIGMTTGTEAK